MKEVKNMKKTGILITTMITLFMLFSVQSIDGKSTWHKYNPEKFAIVKSYEVIHYNSVNWGRYESNYKDKYF